MELKQKILARITDEIDGADKLPQMDCMICGRPLWQDLVKNVHLFKRHDVRHTALRIQACFACANQINRGGGLDGALLQLLAQAWRLSGYHKLAESLDVAIRGAAVFEEHTKLTAIQRLVDTIMEAPINEWIPQSTLLRKAQVDFTTALKVISDLHEQGKVEVKTTTTEEWHRSGRFKIRRKEAL